MRSDPVCKSDVDEKSTLNKAFYKGENYYFCSVACQTQFQANPDSYWGGSATQPSPSQSERKETFRTGAETFSNQTSETAGQMKSMARDMKEKAVERSKSLFATRKQDAAGRLDGTAKAFRQTAQNFQSENRTISRYAGQIADKIEGASQYLREKEAEEVIHDTERFIQRQPVLAFGAAFAIGLMVARFLKSSQQNGARM